MEQLELKHLACYLPYGISVNINGNVQKMNSLDMEAKLVCYGWGNAGFFGEDDIKPILRPLSDLTKEIEHNGEKFVPLYRLIKEDKAFTNDFIDTFGYEELKVSIYELLLKWHFDVFGLIEKGLAININTLN